MTNSTTIKKRLFGSLCLALCAAVLVAACPFMNSSTQAVFAEDLSVDELTTEKEALAAEQEALAARRNEAAQTLEEQKEQAEIIRKQIEAKSAELDINQQLLAELQTAINGKTALIAEQETAIDTLDAQIAEQQATLRVRLREISKKSGFATIIQLILRSDSYTDYLIGFKLSERIAARNEKLMAEIEQNIAALEEAKNQNTSEKASLEIKHAQATKIQEELEAGKSDLQQLYSEANAVAEQMEQNVEYLDEQIAVMEQEQAYLQSTIDAVMEQIRQEEEQKRREEEEKKRQEEEQKRQEEEEQKRQEEENGDNADDDSEGSDSDGEDGSDDSGDSSGEDDSSEDGEDNTGDDSDDGDSDDTEEDYSSVESMLWPAPTCRVITSSFKYREQFKKWHSGLDIACYGDAEGEPIIAAASGKVRVSNRYDEWGGGYGYYLTIDHGYDSQGRRILTVYAHCSEVLVYEGQEVEAGELIAYVGDTGNSYGAHLHFEVVVDGVEVDPVGNGYLSTEWIDILG